MEKTLNRDKIDGVKSRDCGQKFLLPAAIGKPKLLRKKLFRKKQVMLTVTQHQLSNRSHRDKFYF